MATRRAGGRADQHHGNGAVVGHVCSGRAAPAIRGSRLGNLRSAGALGHRAFQILPRQRARARADPRPANLSAFAWAHPSPATTATDSATQISGYKTHAGIGALLHAIPADGGSVSLSSRCAQIVHVAQVTDRGTRCRWLKWGTLWEVARVRNECSVATKDGGGSGSRDRSGCPSRTKMQMKWTWRRASSAMSRKFAIDASIKPRSSRTAPARNRS
jgi:hypothetical protein